jgi:hypothetical protein
MTSSTRFIVIALLAAISTGVSLSAMAESPPKQQQSAKPAQKLDVKKLDLKSKTGSKGSSSNSPVNEQLLSPGVGTAVDIVHGILGR